MNALNVVLFLAIAAGFTEAQLPFGGACPSQNVVNPFDVNQYLGTWFEQAKYFAIFQVGGKCVTAVYTDETNGVVGVNNTQISTITGRPSSIKGTATFSGSSTEAKLTVRFPSVGNFPAPYWVLDTDYTGYAIVWTCNNVFFGLANTQFMWLLTREKNPTAEYITNVKSKITSRGLNAHLLGTTAQDC